uniref:Uncharacterized protein n=1 Tax=Strongyloides stercoralis TaxID=6248 RepID=A0AAF5CQ02_STRER
MGEKSFLILLKEFSNHYNLRGSYYKGMKERHRWDGFGHIYVFERYVTNYHNQNGREVKFKNNGPETSKEIYLFEHLVLQRVQIFEINITFAQTRSDGIRVSYAKNSNLYQTITVGHPKKEHLIQSTLNTCHLLHCQNGFIFIHSKKSGMDIIELKISDFTQIVYEKFITDSGKLLFGPINIEGNHFPLILCPYYDWVNTFSKVTFNPKEKNGIKYSSFGNSHILLPIYPRHSYSTMFICGEMEYIDETKLDIGYEIIIEKRTKKLEVKELNLLKNTLSCKDELSEQSYYYFAYSINNNKEATMKNIFINNFKDFRIYHNNIIYMYDKNGKKIKELEKKGFNFLSETVNNKYNYPIIKPSCAKRVKPLNASLKVFTESGEEIKFSENQENSDIKRFLIDKNIMEKKNKYECRIVIDNINGKEYLKDFYNNVFVGKLISIDDNGNEKIIKTLEFKKNFEGFGKYSCILSSLDGKKLHKDSKYIKPITFETFPSEMIKEIQKTTWQSVRTIIIDCNKKIYNFAKLSDMYVIFSKTSKYKYSVKNETVMFFEENEFVRFKHMDYNFNENNLTKINYHCIYSTSSNATFTIKKSGIILEKEISILKEDNKSKTSTILIVILILLITGIFCAIIISIIIIKKAKKAKKLRKKLGLNSFISNSAMSSSSMSTSTSLSDLSSSISDKSSYSKSFSNATNKKSLMGNKKSKQ